MRVFAAAITFTAVILSGAAADTVYLKNGSVLRNIALTEITPTEIKYKIGQRAVVYTINKSDALKAVYDDGGEDVFDAQRPAGVSEPQKQAVNAAAAAPVAMVSPAAPLRIDPAAAAPTPPDAAIVRHSQEDIHTPAVDSSSAAVSSSKIPEAVPSVGDSTAAGDSLYNELSGGFDSETINRLFGNAGEASPDTANTKKTRALPRFEGDYRILISRPVYASYDKEGASRWVSAMAEIYAYYKVSSFPRTRVYTMEEADGVMHYRWRDRDRKLSIYHYVEAAKKLGATHVIYQEYHPHASGTKMTLKIELYDIKEGAPAAEISDTVKYADFERGLYKCLSAIVDAVDPAIKSTRAFSGAIFPAESRFIEWFGNILTTEDEFTKERSAATYAAAEHLIKDKKNFVGVQYAAAHLADRAGNYYNAITHLNAVATLSGESPAVWWLHQTRLQRRAGQYTAALKAATTAWSNPAIRTPVINEIAMIYKGQGHSERSRKMYNNVIDMGNADGRTFFNFAMLSAEQGNMAECEETLKRGAKAGFALFSDEYYALGTVYGKVSGGQKKAIELLTRSIAANPTRDSVYLTMMDIHLRSGNAEAAADVCVNLFKLNPRKYASQLKRAGFTYLKLGRTDKAGHAYSLFLAQRFVDRDVSFALADIYIRDDRCELLPNVLNPYKSEPEAASMLKQCKNAIKNTRKLSRDTRTR